MDSINFSNEQEAYKVKIYPFLVPKNEKQNHLG